MKAFPSPLLPAGLLVASLFVAGLVMPTALPAQTGPTISPRGAGFGWNAGKLLRQKNKRSTRKEIGRILEIRDDGSLRIWNENRDEEHDIWTDDDTVIKAKRRKDFGKKKLTFDDLAAGQSLEIVSEWRSDIALAVTVLPLEAGTDPEPGSRKNDGDADGGDAKGDGRGDGQGRGDGDDDPGWSARGHAVENFPHLRRKLPGGEGLGQELDGTSEGTVVQEMIVRIARNEEHLRLRTHGEELLGELVATHVRHDHVGQEKVDRPVMG